MKAESRSGGFLGLAKSADVEVQTPKAFAGAGRLVVGGFKIGFNDSKRLQKKGQSVSFGPNFGGRSTGLVKLKGITPDVRQRITDQAYEDFVKALAARGYEVVSREVFTGHAAYAGVKEYAFPYEDDQSGLLSSYGVATYYSPSAIGPKQAIFRTDVPKFTGGFGYSNPLSAVGKFGETTGIPVVYVSYLVDFAGAGGTESLMGSTLQVGQLMSVDRGVLGIGSGQGGTFSDKIGSLTLGQPIGSEIAFAMIEDTSTGVAVGVETALNLLSTMTGRGTNQTREFVVHADPDKYALAARDVLVKAGDRLMDKMVTLR